MNTLLLAVLAGIAAFYAGRFAERARTAHQMFTSYRSRVSSSLTEWLKDSMMTFMFVAALMVIVVANFII